MVVMFVDLRVAFDTVNREILIDAMRKRGLTEELVKSVGEVVKETKSRKRFLDSKRSETRAH